MNSLTTEQIDALPAGIEMDCLVAERVMGERKPAEAHDPGHLYSVTSTDGNWICSPEYDQGDQCEWAPLPFSTDVNAAWKIVKHLEPWVCRFQSTDGLLDLTCSHWSSHGDCIVQTWTEAEERMEEDPRPWSFHIHLGLLAEHGGVPRHWKHQDQFCALGPTAPLVICRAALKSMAGRVSAA